MTFDLPLPATYSDAECAHVAANAIDPSIIVENGDGTCTGIFTVYKAFSDVLGEYTVQMSATSLSGPWTISSGKSVLPAYRYRQSAHQFDGESVAYHRRQ